MNWGDYNKLFHKHELNLVAFKRLMDCDQEVLKLVNAAIEAEREACAKVCEGMAYVIPQPHHYAEAIRARGRDA